MRHTLKHRPCRGRGGAAMLELAVIAPLLVAFLLGTLELSRAMQVKQALSDACRSAGRLAVQPNTTVAQVQANAGSVLTYNGITPGTVAVAINGKTVTDLKSAREGDDVGVTVTVPASSVGYVLPVFLSGESWLSETIVMRRQ